MATPFPFTAGQTLTAAQMNAITELIINDKTASYTLVASDAGEYVVMNSASATTITVNNSIFSASQVVYIVNKGTAATTITAGAGVTISTSGSLTVPANGSGRLLALSASAFIYEAGGITVSSALTFITGATFSAASSVAVDSCFTSTYQNYRIVFIVTASATSTGATTLQWRTGGATNTTANYTRGLVGISSGGSFDGSYTASATSYNLGSTSSSENNYVLALDVYRPQQATLTNAFVTNMPGYGSTTPRFGTLQFEAATAFDGFIVSRTAGTMTGNYRVYGYSNS